MSAKTKTTNSTPPADADGGSGRDDIYNLETAAKRCRVSVKQILDWIDQGLRAFPIGESIKYRARDYVILEEWLLDFFRSRGGILKKSEATDKSAEAPKKKGARETSRNRDQPLGPCPT